MAVDRARIVEAWHFDGTEESVAAALRKYRSISFAWRGNDESFVRCGKWNVQAGMWLCRMDDGSFQPRSERAVRKAGLDPEFTDEDEEDEAEERRRRWRDQAKSAPVTACFFDGTRESVAKLLDTDPTLHFLERDGQPYVLWDEPAGTTRHPRFNRMRFLPGRCLVRLENGKYTRRKKRGIRALGLIE